MDPARTNFSGSTATENSFALLGLAAGRPFGSPHATRVSPRDAVVCGSSWICKRFTVYAKVETLASIALSTAFHAATYACFFAAAIDPA